MAGQITFSRKNSAGSGQFLASEAAANIRTSLQYVMERGYAPDESNIIPQCKAYIHNVFMKIKLALLTNQCTQ
jgi:hypothetical protein